jgi:hypothetical protein
MRALVELLAAEGLTPHLDLIVARRGELENGFRSLASVSIAESDSC